MAKETVYKLTWVTFEIDKEYKLEDGWEVVTVTNSIQNNRILVLLRGTEK